MTASVRTAVLRWFVHERQGGAESRRSFVTNRASGFDPKSPIGEPVCGNCIATTPLLPASLTALGHGGNKNAGQPRVGNW